MRGTVSQQSKRFQRYSGKGGLHLAEFGVEGSTGERDGVEEALTGYLQARDRAEWARACGYLSAPSKAELRQMSRQLKGVVGEDCAVTLQPLLKSFSMGHEPGPENGVASIRVEPGRSGGFALYHGSDGKDYWIAMLREAGAWKLVAISPARFGG